MLDLKGLRSGIGWVPRYSPPVMVPKTPVTTVTAPMRISAFSDGSLKIARVALGPRYAYAPSIPADTTAKRMLADATTGVWAQLTRSGR